MKPITTIKMAQTEWDKAASATVYSSRMLVYIATLLERLLKKPTKTINITIFGKK
jgi:hypothetical protein